MLAISVSDHDFRRSWLACLGSASRTTWSKGSSPRSFVTWAPVLIAPAALLLGRIGLGRARGGQGGRAYAVGGTLLGLASLGIFLAIGSYAVFNHGNYPWIFGG
jgi:hypothetical protein